MNNRCSHNISLAVCCIIVTGCTTLPRRTSQTRSNPPQTISNQSPGETSDAKLIDINRATQSELERLPGIGAGYAARIIEHRVRYGKFRRKEQLLIVPGIGERRYREIEKFIKVASNLSSEVVLQTHDVVFA